MSVGSALQAPSGTSTRNDLPAGPSRVLLAGGLLLVYLAISVFIEPMGHLSTDVGGKTASVSAMAERGDWNPDIGYWFEDHDPTGEFHAFAHTRHTANDQWINTTSFTMVLPAAPLWSLAGPRGALLLPMLGSVLAALAAGALQRRIDPASNGTSATLFIGLASPALIYALDFWEHSWGLALMAFGIVLVIDALDTGHARLAVAAGLLYGLAATMRQEALVYGFVAGLLLVLVPVSRRRLTTTLVHGTSFGVAAVVPVAMHFGMEQLLLGGASRTARGAGTLGEAGSAVSERLFAAIATTSFALASSVSLSWILSGALLVAMVATATTAKNPGSARHELATKAMVASWALLLTLLIVLGVGFVPGLAIAAPATLFGVVAALRERLLFPLVLGGGPLPLVLLTAFPDGSLPQWGGRYLLVTGLVFSVIGLSWLERHAPSVRTMVAVCSVAVTLVGVAWTIERTAGVYGDAEQLTALTNPTDVVIWRSPYQGREMGPIAEDRSWLSAPFSDDQRRLAPLLRDASVTEFIWLARPDVPTPEFPGFEEQRSLGRLDFFGVDATRWIRTAN